MKIFSRLPISCLPLVICLLLISSQIQAQSCTETLDEVKAYYDQGNFYPIPGLLDDCLRGGFTEEQKVEALEILTIIYNYNAELDSASESFLELLKTDPIYRPDSNKQVEIEYISKRFKTDPVWTIHGPKIGMNWTFTQIINNNGTDNTENSRENYIPKIGGHIAAGVELTISRHFSLLTEGVFYVRSYQYENFFYNDFDRVLIDDQQIGIEVPITLKYQFAIKSKKTTDEIDKWYPFFTAGYALNFLLQDRSLVEYNSREGNSDVPNILASGENIKLTKIRNNFNTAITVGTGVKYRLRTNYISLDVRYSFGLKNVVNPDNQFDFQSEDEFPRTTDNSPIRAYTFGYSVVDDDFRLDNLFVSIGYIHPIYKPRPINKKSIGDLIKGLFKKKEKDADFY